MLLLLFLVVPIVELAVIVQVGQAIGTIPTLGLLVLMSVAGAWLMKREGVGVLRRLQVMALGATLGPAAGRRRPGGRSGVIDV